MGDMERKNSILYNVSFLFLAITVVLGAIQPAHAEFTGLVAEFGEFEEHLFSVLAESDATTVAYTNPASLFPLDQGYFDAVDAGMQESGTLPAGAVSKTFYVDPAHPFAPIPFAFDGTSSWPMEIVKGHEEAQFTFEGLDSNAMYKVTVHVDNLGDFGIFEDPGLTTPALEEVFVTGGPLPANNIELGSVSAVWSGGVAIGDTNQLITKTLPVAAISSGTGTLTIGFNNLFHFQTTTPAAWDVAPFYCTPNKTGPGALFPPGDPTPKCIPAQSGIRVTEISLELMPNPPVGGTDIPINTASLLLAGATSVSMWMIPVILTGAGIGIFVMKKRN
jgi:hypothetical protein